MPIRCLDLFSGTHSFSTVAKALGYECVTLDISAKHNPDIVCDILEFDYKIWPIGYFDFIWASPPCNTFSIIRNSNIGKNGFTKEKIEDDIDNIFDDSSNGKKSGSTDDVEESKRRKKKSKKKKSSIIDDIFG